MSIRNIWWMRVAGVGIALVSAVATLAAGARGFWHPAFVALEAVVFVVLAGILLPPARLPRG